MKNFQLLVYSAFLVACILVSACIGNQENSAPVVPSPTTENMPVNGTSIDLTNQNSPQAATFREGGSHTELVTPQPLIRLEKVAGGFSSPMMIAVPPDGTGRLLVVDQIGVVRIPVSYTHLTLPTNR